MKKTIISIIIQLHFATRTKRAKAQCKLEVTDMYTHTQDNSMYEGIYVHMNAYVYAHICACMCVCTHTCVCILTYICLFMFIEGHCVSMCVCMCVIIRLPDIFENQAGLSYSNFIFNLRKRINSVRN